MASPFESPLGPPKLSVDPVKPPAWEPTYLPAYTEGPGGWRQRINEQYYATAQTAYALIRIFQANPVFTPEKDETIEILIQERKVPYGGVYEPNFYQIFLVWSSDRKGILADCNAGLLASFWTRSGKEHPEVALLHAQESVRNSMRPGG
ncbi:MAG: hypothetical protein A2W35_06495 [Chloroflexi bacterium RBG_16_57_11]|nr:MAG: hypothetical protein A2W35_06495 [Chloroflexi bacterium RBG_16_57_11]